MIGLSNLLAVAQLHFRRCFRLRMASTAVFPCGASSVLAHQHRSPFRSASLGSAEGLCLLRGALPTWLQLLTIVNPPVQRHWGGTASLGHSSTSTSLTLSLSDASTPFACPERPRRTLRGLQAYYCGYWYPRVGGGDGEEERRRSRAARGATASTTTTSSTCACAARAAASATRRTRAS